MSTPTGLTPSYGASGAPNGAAAAAGGGAAAAGGGASAEDGGGGGSGKVAALRSQVNEVKDVMSKNIEKVMERGDNLDNLVTKTTDLEAGAAVFRDRTKVVRRKMWWKNAKMNIVLGVVAVAVILIIILSTVDWSPSSTSSASSATTITPT